MTQIVILVIAGLVGLAGLLLLVVSGSILPELSGVTRISLGIGLIVGAAALLIVYPMTGAYLLWTGALSEAAQSKADSVNLPRVRQTTARLSVWLVVQMVLTALLLVSSLFTPQDMGQSPLGRSPVGWLALVISAAAQVVNLWQLWANRDFALKAQASASRGELSTFSTLT
ncbi:hypothetical protein [Deinococcus sp.]|uniref:hypothetical protein n=1 Tax=Deinococcus sp. TaxID=47478 RepID=UPI0025D21495|nr:hypothetical protein [Deinococcus sp.]